MVLGSFNAILTSWDANSFVSVPEADDYFLYHIDHSRWDALEAASKQRVLVSATQVINSSPLFGLRYRLYETEPYKQALKVPDSEHDTISGSVSSGTHQWLICSSLADTDEYRDDYFKNGAIRITSGIGANTIRKIVAFDVDTGKIYVKQSDDDDGVEWAYSPNTTSEFTIIYPMPEEFISGVCEQALDMLRGGHGEVQRAISEGQGVNQTYSLVCPMARALLAPWYSSEIKLSR